MPVETLRIFISSPGDVAEERAKAREVIAQLQRWYGERVVLAPVLWEDLPLSPDSSFQDGIDLVLSEELGIDIAVFILWNRMGSPLGAKEESAPAADESSSLLNKYFGCQQQTPLNAAGKAYRSGTEREIDLMLQAADATGGERPDLLFYRRFDDDAFLRKLGAEKDPAAFEEMVRQKQSANEFIAEMFHDEEGHNTRAYHSYQQPVEFSKRLKLHLRQLIDQRLERTGATGSAQWMDAPYRGLDTFHAVHSDIFFGREEETWKLEELLRRREQAPDDGTAFVVVLGASGSGKSSLVQAGLQASLTRFNMDDSIAAWRSVVLLPGQSGGSPLQHLVREAGRTEILPELTRHHHPEELARELARDPAAAVRLVFGPAFSQAKLEAGGPVKFLLIIDQFEELFTDTRISEEECSAFLRTLEVLASSGSCWVVATMRSDFYSVAQQSREFLRLKGQSGQFDVLAPAADALRRMIEEPARLAGVRFERLEGENGGQPLSAKILHDAQQQPDGLPLLQDLLMELYERRTPENVMTFAVYEELGGLEGALVHRAESVFSELPRAQQKTFPGLLHALVNVDPSDGGTAVRRRANRATLDEHPDVKELLDTLIQARLLTARELSSGEGASVSLSHEALLRSWPRISEWVRGNQEHLRIRSRVEHSCLRWREKNRHDSLLLPKGLSLEEGISLTRRAPHLLVGSDYDIIRTYVRASVAHVNEQQRRARKMRQVAMLALSVLTLFAMAGGAVAWMEREKAVVARDDADGLIGFMLDELQPGLESVGRVALLEGVIEEIESYLARSTPKSWSALHNHARMRLARAKVLRSLGRTQESEQELLRALDLLNDGRFRSAPLSYREQLLAELQLWLGDAQSHRPETLLASRSTLEASISILDRYARSESTGKTAGAQLTLALVFLGDTERQLGQPDRALDHYHRAAVLARDNPDQDPRQTRLLLETLDRTGNLRLQTGETPKALAAYEEYALLADALAAAHPGDIRHASHQARSHLLLASQHLGTSPEQAETHLELAEVQFQQLLEQESRNVLWRRQLGETYHFRAQLHEEDGEIEAARTSHQKGLEQMRLVAADDESNAVLQRSLAKSWRDLGGFEVRQEAFQAGLIHLEEASRILQHIGDSASEKPPELHAGVIDLRGDAQRGLGNLEGARKLYEEGIQRRLSYLSSTEKDADPTFLQSLADAHYKLAEFYRRTHPHLDLAVANFEQANLRWQEVISGEPDSLDPQLALANGLIGQAKAHLKLATTEDLRGAEQALLEASRASKAVLAQDSSHPEGWYTLALGNYFRAQVAGEREEAAGVLLAYSSSVEAFRQLWQTGSQEQLGTILQVLEASVSAGEEQRGNREPSTSVARDTLKGESLELIALLDSSGGLARQDRAELESIAQRVQSL